MASNFWFWMWYFQTFWDSPIFTKDDFEAIGDAIDRHQLELDQKFAWCDTFFELAAFWVFAILLTIVFLAYIWTTEDCNKKDNVQVTLIIGAILYFIAVVIAYFADKSLGLR